MVEFLKRPQMEKLTASARSLDRDGKVLYKTFLHLKSLTRRNKGWKMEKYRTKWGPLGATWQPRQQPPYNISCQISGPVSKESGTNQWEGATSAPASTAECTQQRPIRQVL